MRIFLVIMILLTLQNIARAEVHKMHELDRGYNPSIIINSENEDKCLEYVDSLNITQEQNDDLTDQCMDQAY